MKIIELDQNSQEWLEWRESVNSASEAPAVMGESAYMPKTPYELYQVKTGQREVFYNNAMKDGHKFESTALNLANLKFNANYQPVCGESEEHERLGASLDGYDPNTEVQVLEIKTTTQGSKIWDNGLEIYKWQLVHQCLTAGTDKAILFVYCKESGESKHFDFKLKKTDANKLLKAWAKFNKAMDSFTAPELTDKDWTENQTADWSEKASEYLAIKEQIEQLKAKQDEVKQELIELADGQPTRGAGISVSKTTRKGNINYVRAIKELDLDASKLEQFRNKSTEFFTVR